MSRGERWDGWRLKAAALGAPLPEVPPWARRDPRLVDVDWAVIVAIAEQAGGDDVQAIVRTTAEQIAAQIIDPHPNAQAVGEVAGAIQRLQRLGIVVAGPGVLLLRPLPIPMATQLEPRLCSDEALLEWIETLPEADALVARNTYQRAQASLRGEAVAS